MVQKYDTLTAKHLCLLIKSPDVEDSAADRKKRSLDQKRRAHTCFCRLCCLLPPTFQLKHVWNKQYVNHLLWIYERKANICARKECASFLHVFALRLWGQNWCICSLRLLKKGSEDLVSALLLPRRKHPTGTAEVLPSTPPSAGDQRLWGG